MSLLSAASEEIGVLVVESNRMRSQLLTGALRRHATFRVNTCPMDTSAILQSLSERMPQVALLSLNVPASVSETIMTLRRFHLAHPGVPKVLLLESCDRELALTAFRSGARGIFSIAEANLRMLCKCLQKVAAGQIWASTEQLGYLLELVSEVPSVRLLSSRGDSLLTPREGQVVGLVAEGLGNRQIARELNLSEHTIKKYLFRVFEKLGVSSRVELVLYAVNNGETRPQDWLAGARIANA